MNAILSPKITLAFEHLGMIGKDGKCFSFDARANGYARGEGCGVVIVKPLSAAVRNGDRVYSVVRGTAINHNGYSFSAAIVILLLTSKSCRRYAGVITAPSGDAHRKLMIAAYSRAGIAPSQVSYVEAHGTGTKVRKQCKHGVRGLPLRTESTHHAIAQHSTTRLRLPNNVYFLRGAQ